MSTTTTPTAKWDVAADDGTEFVVSVNGKSDAEKLAAEKLAELGKPTAKFTVTLAERADGEPLADDLLSGIEPDPVQVKEGERPSEAVKRTAAERQAKPDPKPNSPHTGAIKPAGRSRSRKPAAKKEPTAASTKRQIADAAAADKPKAAKNGQTKHELLMSFAPEAAEVWNALTPGDNTVTARDCRTRVLEHLENAHKKHAPGKDGKGGLFRGRIPAMLNTQGIDARQLPAHFKAGE